jgi:hypothetical protein
MLRWLRRLFGKRDALGYADADREIFEYWDGQRVRRGDPLAIHRTIICAPEEEFNIKVDPKAARVPTPEGLLATGRMAAIVRKAFDVKSVDEGGLTDGECIRLFVEFGALIRVLEDDARPLASSPRPTAAAAGGGDLPTPFSADSPSTPSGTAAATS